jgi:hypothetical protein
MGQWSEPYRQLADKHTVQVCAEDVIAVFNVK